MKKGKKIKLTLNKETLSNMDNIKGGEVYTRIAACGNKKTFYVSCKVTCGCNPLYFQTENPAQKTCG